MSSQQDIIIIGAGLIGLCTADALALKGARVRVIDARPGPCEGTSFSNSGMIHPSQAVSWDLNQKISPELARARLDAARVTARLGERSKQLLMEKMKSLGLSPLSSGCVQLFDDMDAASIAQSGYDEIGIGANILIDSVDTFGKVACQFPNDTSGDAREFGCALAADLKARGVKFTYDAADFDIRQSENQFLVRTSQGVHTSEHVVVAAGVQSVDCLSRLGVRMNLKPIAGAAADFALPDDIDDLPSCPVMDAQSRSAMTVFSDRVRISGGWGLDDPESLLERWRDIAPGLMLRLGQARSTWTGLRPVSPVGRPYISGTSVRNLWVNTGHGHMGWTLCAGSGELLAEMLMDGSADKRFAFLG
ncbi:MAG: FAD-dependent oxidoreductase [Litorimonas sp.]